MNNSRQNRINSSEKRISPKSFKELNDFPVQFPIVLFSSDGKIYFQNKAFKELSELNENDTVFNFSASPSLKDVISQIHQSFFRNVEFKIEVKSPATENKTEFKAFLTKVWTGQQLVFLLMLKQDKADVKKPSEEEFSYSHFEQEQRLSRLKSAFLANMSHEFRTPLNAVVGYSDLIAEEVKEKNYDVLPEIISYMKDGVKRLLNLIDNIVEVSMIEANDQSVELERSSVNQLIRESLNSFKEETQRTGINIDLELDHSDPQIKTDGSRFKKIIEALISNAVKYNHKNGIVMIRTNSDRKSVEIEISDTGIGIEEKKLKTILEPFSQVEEEVYRRNYEGAGLGLTIAYNLTKLFKGTFEIQSRVNEGTTIRLQFPKDV